MLFKAFSTKDDESTAADKAKELTTDKFFAEVAATGPMTIKDMPTPDV